MKNTVFMSFENVEHDRCVDVFQRPDGTYGFEEFRRDVEDQGRWQSMARHSHRSFEAEAQALAAAGASVAWLAGNPTWLRYLQTVAGR